MTAAALRTLDHPLARVAYADAGQGGPALVWVHGALCSHEDWAGSVAHFAPCHRCIAPDLPGHGASPAGPAAISVRAYARIVRDLCAALGLSDVVLVGHSMGCRVALQAAVGEPGEPGEGPLPGLRGLVLVDGAYLTTRPLAGLPAAQRQALAAEAHARAAALFATQAPAERAARGFAQMFFDPAFDALRDRMIERAGALPPEVARTLMPDFAAWDVARMEDVLPQVQVPVLAFACTWMNGAHERVRLEPGLSTPWLDALARHLPGTRVVRVPGAGHFPMLEQPQAVHERIAGWLAALAEPCAGRRAASAAPGLA